MPDLVAIDRRVFLSSPILTPRSGRSRPLDGRNDATIALLSFPSFKAKSHGVHTVLSCSRRGTLTICARPRRNAVAKRQKRRGPVGVGRRTRKAVADGEKRVRKRPIEQYDHRDKQRANNPPVGLVTPETDADDSRRIYRYDPHIDPAVQFDSGGGKGRVADVERLIDTALAADTLDAAKKAVAELKKRRQPYLNWAGKAERTTFQVPTVSLHVHERIDPRTIVEAVRARNGPGNDQMRLFEQPSENPPLREAIDFYKHPHNWSNRLIAGDSLLVMNSLLEKEGMAGKVQMIYIDPPYGIKYGSNFQPFVSTRDVADGKDDDLTQEPETLRAFRDTWELGIHSYLTYLRDRLLLAKELLHESGTCFVQIGDANVHHVKELMEEVFGQENFISQITFLKTSGSTGAFLATTADYLLFFARDSKKLKYRKLFLRRASVDQRGPYNWIERADGTRRHMSAEERSNPSLIPAGSRIFRLDNLQSQSVGREKGEGAASWFPVRFEGREWRPDARSRWKTNEEGMTHLVHANRLGATGSGLYYVRYSDDFPAYPVTNVWSDTTTAGFSADKKYVVETNTKVVQRCILMATDPGDLVFDPTCGSGTTAYVAEQWGRRWITCDTSRVAITLAKQRLMTALFDYYHLAHPDQAVAGGFVYGTVSHVTLKSIARNPEIREGMTREALEVVTRKYAGQETMYDEPDADGTKARVTGPFTVEAVPAPVVKPVSEAEKTPASDSSVAREGETLRQAEWRAELLKTGARGDQGQVLGFSRMEALPGCAYLHAEGEVASDGGYGKVIWKRGQRVVVSFGPEHAPLEPRRVELAWEEARQLEPRPGILLFAAFEFDPEASKDIDALDPAKTRMVFLKAKMNGDLLTEDLKKKRSSNESFWLIGQPEIELRTVKNGPNAHRWQVEIIGFDYFNPKTGQIESGDTKKIAMWLLDTDYDGRSLYPRQVFFPMAGLKDGWARLAASLRAEIAEDKIEAYRGVVSLAFDRGKHGRIAVKIVDDRGIESLVVRALAEAR